MAEALTPNPLHPLKQGLIMLGVYITAEVILVAFAYFWVFLYSVLIYSEGDSAYYESYAQFSSPIVAVVLAGPVFFLIGRFLRRRYEAALRLALGAATLNIFVSVLLLASIDISEATYNVAMMGVATLAMLTGAYLGARGER